MLRQCGVVYIASGSGPRSIPAAAHRTPFTRCNLETVHVGVEVIAELPAWHVWPGYYMSLAHSNCGLLLDLFDPVALAGTCRSLGSQAGAK